MSLLIVAATLLPACSLLVGLNGFAGGEDETKSSVGDGGGTDPDPDTGTLANAEGGADASCDPPVDPPQTGTTYYVSPTGLDANPGTRDLPFLTFTTALPKLHAGDTLMLADGVYTKATTGVLTLNCNAGLASGTPYSPILVRSENERRAWIQGDGTGPAIYVVNCNFWTFDGLYASGADFAGTQTPASQGGIVSINYSTSTKVRRSLIARTNRCLTGSGSLTTDAIQTYNAPNTLIEDNEIYDYHAKGIGAYGDATLRGNYTNPRNYAQRNPPACAVGSTTQGQVDQGKGTVFENAVAEGNDIGLRGGERSYVVGSIALDNVIGLYGQAFWETLTNGVDVRDTVLVANQTAIKSDGWAFTLDHVTVLGNSKKAIVFTDNGGTSQPPRNLFASRTLFSQNGAIDLQSADSWTFDTINSFDNTPTNYPTAEAIGDNAGNIQRSLSVPSGMGLGSGQCAVYVPQSSPLRSAPGGGDIGANLVNRYRDQKVTCERFWNATTGMLRCGATVAGVNDDSQGMTIETRACINVHRRLNVGTNGCAVP